MRASGWSKLSLCVFMMLFAGLAVAQKDEKPGTGAGTVGYFGSVKKVDPESKVIELDKGRKFSINDNTEIMRAGKAISVDQIKAGDKASVTVSKRADEHSMPVALKITM